MSVADSEKPGGGATSGLRIIAFESRMAEETKKLIERHGCRAFVVPVLREVELGDTPEIVHFGQQLMAGAFDVVIFLTGVGTKALCSLLLRRYSSDDIVRALQTIVVVARGPKTIRALREFGITANLPVDEPNTWREILSAIDGRLAVNGRGVAVQEYGASNPELLGGLRERGARVFSVAVYRWSLPQDCSPLRAAIDSIIAGQHDVALFTSAAQIANLSQVAKSDAKLPRFIRAFGSMLVG